MTEPTGFIDIKVRKPNEKDGQLIEVRADTHCVVAQENGAMDHLTDGVVAKWPTAVVALSDCSIGELVFAKIVANDPKFWVSCEVASEVRSKREGSG